MKKIFLIFLVSLIVISGCQLSGEDLIEENLSKLDDENPFNRQQAVAALGATLNESVIKPIALMLNDPDQKVVDQAYNELSRLYTVDKPVVSNILELFRESDEDWIESALIYLVESEEIKLKDVVIENIELISQNLDSYRDLLLLAEIEENTLEELWEKEKDEQISTLILYYDKLGYTPTQAKYEETVSGGAITSNEIELLLQLIIRDSFNTEYDQSGKIFLNLSNGQIEKVTNFTQSKERCEQADKFIETFDDELNLITQILLIKDNQPRFDKFFRDILATGYEEEQLLIDDLDKLERDSLEIVSSYLASLPELNERIENDLEVQELMASAFIEHSPSEDLLNHKKILVVYSDGTFNKKLHWQLNSEYRPNSKDEIRYIFSIPKISGLLTLTDRYSYEELIHQEIGDETDLYELLNEAIDIIEKE